MAEEAKEAAPDVAAEQENVGTSSGKLGFLRRFFSYRNLSIFLLATVIFQGTLFAYYQFGSAASEIGGTAEVSLGTFHFDSDEAEGGRVSYAEFGLHIALLDEVDSQARHQLEVHQFRLQQDIEELLREAQSGDFDDPSLCELKRQLQERINATLKMRAIADVIITDLTVQWNDQAVSTPTTETAELVPWVEKPSS
ncbi:MAG TPA: flagellar basal body-associated FliL family protein [Thermoguttaceae bacterium]|nr:flagellar basal body-associated FliL family protein [Thermoguttaceae bacterium]